MMIWWILPALAGIVGLAFSFAGIGRLLKLRLAAGGLRFLFGIGFLGAAGIGTLLRSASSKIIALKIRTR